MTTKKAKAYCPYCDLEMNGSTHEDEGRAWGMYECEYSADDKENYSRPVVTELERNNLTIARITKEKNEINSSIRKLKARNIELSKND